MFGFSNSSPWALGLGSGQGSGFTGLGSLGSRF